MASRTVLLAMSVGAILLCLDGGLRAADDILPQGKAPAPIVTRHFPDRVHEFIWRNWSVVEPAKLAKILGASEKEVTALAESMGLPAAMAIPPEQKSRGYITVIRRNWHLLPYNQLLELLDMTPEQLAFTLREDDFLFIKLGNLKPQCQPLRYVAPDDAARRRADEIRRVVQEDFGKEALQPAEARFHFLREFYENVSPAAPESLGPAAKADGGDEQVRFIYSYFAVYGDPLLNPQLDPYPDGLLQRLAKLGINGVWLHVVLRDLAPGGAAFPEFGAGSEKRLANLRALTQRAKKFGIGVYLYMNEPRAMPAAFFQNRPEMAGVREGDFIAMCTSHPAVRQWMSDALEHVFREAPDLAGVFTITASENLTNCASHGKWKQCPRCKDRTDAEILAEVNGAIADGVHRGNPKAKVIAWDWGWRGHGDAAEIIALLPKSVCLMSVSEWALPLNRGGVAAKVGEYSISAVGPGPRALGEWKAAQDAGLKIFAKVQLNNTWELSSVPYLPVMDLVAQHCRNLASAGVDGMMLSWTLGGYPSPNLEIAAAFRASNSAAPAATGRPIPSVDEVLNALAAQRYGPQGAASARKAWTAFSTAFQEYPYHGAVLYDSPVQMGPANPLYLEKTGYRATMSGIPYDDLTSWRAVYPPEVFASQFEKVAQGWRSGLPLLQAAVEKAPAEHTADVTAELRFARAAAIHFQSVANQARFVMARDKLAKPAQPLSAEQRKALRAEVRGILHSEIDLARQLYALAREDSRLGFEASNQYFYVPLDLVEKVINCRWLLDQFKE